MYNKELTEIMSLSDVFNKAFDNIRLVDPIEKQVIKNHNNKLEDTGIQCYEFWGKNKVCDNCISLRACKDNKTYIKLEYSNGGIYMVIAIPIEVSNRKVVLELLKKATDSLVVDSFDNERVSEIYSMIDNMNYLALNDALTGLYNRRYINENLPINLTNAALAETEISVIMADIDYFKNVNDTFGHLGGDGALKFFAGILSQSLKKENDWVARYGGDEFIICLPGINLTNAIEIAEKIRRNVETSSFAYGENQIKITASFGVVSINSKTVIDINELIESVDKKLYEAKRKGRNRIEA